MAEQTTSSKERQKKELQRQIGETRDSLRNTVEQIQDRAEEKYQAVKETVSDVLDYRDEFQKEPVIWSLGALSAGFALGYTLGYSHKIAKSKKDSQIATIADSGKTERRADLHHTQVLGMFGCREPHGA